MTVGALWSEMGAANRRLDQAAVRRWLATECYPPPGRPLWVSVAIARLAIATEERAKAEVAALEAKLQSLPDWRAGIVVIRKLPKFSIGVTSGYERWERIDDRGRATCLCLCTAASEMGVGEGCADAGVHLPIGRARIRQIWPHVVEVD